MRVLAKETAHYIFALAETEISISIWLVADETSESGLALANAARQLVVSRASG